MLITAQSESGTIAFNPGKWTAEEEDSLKETVRRLTAQQQDINGTGFWSQVSQAMEGQRDRQQCREKW
jgi:hypothetical protein